MSPIQADGLRWFGLFVYAVVVVQSNSVSRASKAGGELDDVRATEERVELLFEKCYAAFQKHDYDEADRIEALIEATGRPAVPVLLRELNVKDKDRCYVAIACLHGIEPLPVSAAPRLINVLEATEDARLCTAALRALGHCGDGKWAKGRTRLLARLLRHPDAMVRMEGVIAVKYLQEEGKEFLPSILSIMERDPNANNRNAAARASIILAPGDPMVIDALVKQIDGPAKVGAMEAMAIAGAAARRAIPAIAGKARGGDDDAVRALGTLGVTAKEAIPALTDLLKTDKQGSVNTQAVIEALGRIDPGCPLVVSAMRRVLQGQIEGAAKGSKANTEVETLAAIRVLVKAGRRARAALPELTEMLKGNSSLLQAESAAAIRVIVGDIPEVTPPECR